LQRLHEHSALWRRQREKLRSWLSELTIEPPTRAQQERYLKRDPHRTELEGSMTDESRRSGLVAAAAGAQAAWQRLYERLLQVEFDGYAGADADVFLRAMETVLNAHRATPSADRQAVEIFRQLFDEAIAELDRKQPRRT
jgi:hypothetical protein